MPDESQCYQQIPFFNQLEILHDHARELPDMPEWPAIAQVIDGIMISVATTETAISEILAAAQDKIEALQIQLPQ